MRKKGKIVSPWRTPNQHNWPTWWLLWRKIFHPQNHRLGTLSSLQIGGGETLTLPPPGEGDQAARKEVSQGTTPLMDSRRHQRLVFHNNPCLQSNLQLLPISPIKHLPNQTSTLTCKLCKPQYQHPITPFHFLPHPCKGKGRRGREGDSTGEIPLGGGVYPLRLSRVSHLNYKEKDNRLYGKEVHVVSV